MTVDQYYRVDYSTYVQPSIVNIFQKRYQIRPGKRGHLFAAHFIPQGQIAQALSGQQLQVRIVTGKFLHQHIDGTGYPDKLGNVVATLLKPIAQFDQILGVGMLAPFDPGRQAFDILTGQILDLLHFVQ